MGPVEIVFLVVILIFGLIGIVRGANRELGVTVILVLALLLIQITYAFPRANDFVNQIIAFLVGPDPATQQMWRAILNVLFLLLMTFIAYQGVTIVYPAAARGPILGLLVGLLNGYLLAGSIWYYLARAGWPGDGVVPPFTTTYWALARILPPEILTWPFLLAILAILLIGLVWR